jgi:coenzyme F420-reducing hydrogenase alpha subunit
MQKQVDQQFENMVNEWVDLDDVETNAKKELKNLRDRKKLLGQQILHYIKSNNIHTVNIPGGTLKYCVSKRKPSIKKDTIRENLLQSHALKDPRAIDSVMEYIYTSNGVVETEYLKRTGRPKDYETTASIN